jgi:hypothetical protein
MNEASSPYEGTHGNTQGLVSPRRASPSLVLEFLRLTLADGPVTVTDVEAEARAAGLLGPGQEITGAKLFRRAKKSLGIRSKRVGFGAAGDWFWQLPVPPCSPVSERPEQPATKDVPAGATYVERWSDPEQSCAESGAEVGFLPVQMRGSRPAVSRGSTRSGVSRPGSPASPSLTPTAPLLASRLCDGGNSSTTAKRFSIRRKAALKVPTGKVGAPSTCLDVIRRSLSPISASPACYGRSMADGSSKFTLAGP